MLYKIAVRNLWQEIVRLEAQKFMVRIGKYDHKLGPVCLSAVKDTICNLTNETCQENACALIRDALISKKEQNFFEIESQSYHSNLIGINRPQMRGGIERYLLLIHVPQEYGRLKTSILDNMITKFKSLFQTDSYEPTLEEFKNYRKTWELILNASIGITELSEFFHLFRNKLNIIAGYLQLIQTEDNLSASSQDFAQKALDAIFDFNDLIELLNQYK